MICGDLIKKAEGLISRGIYKLEDLYGNDEILTDLNLKDRQFMQLEKMVTRDKNEFVDDLLYDEIGPGNFLSTS